MFKRVGFFSLFLLSLFTLTSSVLALKIAAPSYIYPGPEYNTIASSSAVQIVMFNPSNGVFNAADPGYTAQLAKNKAAGKATYGYVSTSYFNKTIDGIKANIDEYAKDYPGIEGIFFDEANPGLGTSESAVAQEWQDLISYASSKGMKTILNFGQDEFGASLEGLDAIIVNYEGNATNYLNKSFQQRHSGTKYYQIVYEVTPDLVDRVAAKASNIAGYIYMSDYAQQEGAYTKVPGIWAQENGSSERSQRGGNNARKPAGYNHAWDDHAGNYNSWCNDPRCYYTRYDACCYRYARYLLPQPIMY